MYTRQPVENVDTVSLVCALLVRFPELASIRALPGDGTVRLTFAAKVRLDRAAQAALSAAIEDHVGGFLMLEKAEPATARVECVVDRAMSFVHVTRDLETFSKEELEMLVALFVAQFGEKLVCNPVADDCDGDPAAQDEVAVYAVEALRDPKLSKNLVGFREEKHVLVYFLKNKKAKSSARR